MPPLSLETLRRRHALTDSRFGIFGGIPVHYAVEGDGPPLVLLHGSFLDLTSWDSWVRGMRGERRIIRLDRLRSGLTGHDPAAVVDYAAELEMLTAFVDGLGLSTFALAGTSSGGMVAALFAATMPERVERLILMNFPLSHGAIQTGAAQAAPPSPEAMIHGVMNFPLSHGAIQTGAAQAAPPSPEAMIHGVVARNLVDSSAVTPAHMARLVDFACREDTTGTASAAWDKASHFTEAERRDYLARITAPTLVIWSAQNVTLPVEQAQMALDAIGSADKYLTIIEGAGHMHPLEKGAVSADAVAQFLAGEPPAARIS